MDVQNEIWMYFSVDPGTGSSIACGYTGVSSIMSIPIITQPQRMAIDLV